MFTQTFPLFLSLFMQADLTDYIALLRKFNREKKKDFTRTEIKAINKV